MGRAAYRALIWLHPSAFRREFGAGMVWIFEEEGGGAPLFADALASLARQWLIGAGVWKVAVAAVGGMISIATILAALGPKE